MRINIKVHNNDDRWCVSNRGIIYYASWRSMKTCLEDCEYDDTYNFRKRFLERMIKIYGN